MCDIRVFALTKQKGCENLLSLPCIFKAIEEYQNLWATTYHLPSHIKFQSHRIPKGIRPWPPPSPSSSAHPSPEESPLLSPGSHSPSHRTDHMELGLCWWFAHSHAQAGLHRLWGRWLCLYSSLNPQSRNHPIHPSFTVQAYKGLVYGESVWGKNHLILVAPNRLSLSGSIYGWPLLQ